MGFQSSPCIPLENYSQATPAQFKRLRFCLSLVVTCARETNQANNQSAGDNNRTSHWCVILGLSRENETSTRRERPVFLMITSLFLTSTANEKKVDHAGPVSSASNSTQLFSKPTSLNYIRVLTCLGEAWV